MFISGVGGTDIAFLIITIIQKNTEYSLCAMNAPTGLAAFNAGGVAQHSSTAVYSSLLSMRVRLSQLVIGNWIMMH